MRFNGRLQFKNAWYGMSQEMYVVIGGFVLLLDVDMCVFAHVFCSASNRGCSSYSTGFVQKQEYSISSIVECHKAAITDQLNVILIAI
jgi:hypothetical protein